MPLVMATSSQMQRCPQSWGVPETATVQDVMGKVMELEKAMADNIECQRQQMVDSIESQRQQMDLMKQELLSRKVEVRTPVIPHIVMSFQETHQTREESLLKLLKDTHSS